jgi:ADP-ribose pyrophosphatase YjhB (NUDIX family)
MFEADRGYATPKIDVRAAVISENRILLVRERSDGLWTMPGGWADVGDSPSIAAVRETREESGYEVRVTKLIALLDRDRHGHPPIPHHAYKVFFLCELIGGEPVTSSETDQVGFFPENELPPLSLTRLVPSEVALAFQHHRNPQLPTAFD